MGSFKKQNLSYTWQPLRKMPTWHLTKTHTFHQERIGRKSSPRLNRDDSAPRIDTCTHEHHVSAFAHLKCLHQNTELAHCPPATIKPQKWVIPSERSIIHNYELKDEATSLRILRSSRYCWIIQVTTWQTDIELHKSLQLLKVLVATHVVTNLVRLKEDRVR